MPVLLALVEQQVMADLVAQRVLAVPRAGQLLTLPRLMRLSQVQVHIHHQLIQGRQERPVVAPAVVLLQ